jgi:hypothetical protein
VLRPFSVFLLPSVPPSPLARCEVAIATLRPRLNILQLVLTGSPLCRNQTRHRPTIIGNRAVSREPQLPITVITMLTAA